MPKCKNVTYNSTIQKNIVERITDGAQHYINTIYHNGIYGFYWYENSKGFIHVLKPIAVKADGKIQYYAIEDNRLRTDGILASDFFGTYQTIADAEKAIINYFEEVQQ